MYARANLAILTKSCHRVSKFRNGDEFGGFDDFGECDEFGFLNRNLLDSQEVFHHVCELRNATCGSVNFAQ